MKKILFVLFAVFCGFGVSIAEKSYKVEMVRGDKREGELTQLFLNKRNDEVVALASQYLESGDFNKNIARHYRARALLRMGKLDAALKDYDVLVQSEKPSAYYYTGRADVLMGMNKFAEAQKDLEAAVKMDEKNADAFYKLGICRLEAEDYKEACAGFAKAAELNPESHDYYRDWLNAAYKDGGIAAVIQVFDVAIKNHPKEKYYYAERAKAKGSMKDFKGAEEDFGRIIEMDPADTIAYAWRSEFRLYQENYKGAEEDCTEVLKYDPKSVHALFNRGQAYMKREMFDESQKDFNAVLELDPESAVAYSNRAECRMLAKDYKGALEDIAKARELGAPGENFLDYGESVCKEALKGESDPAKE